MKMYVLTEEQRSAMLKELELEKFHVPTQFALTDAEKSVEEKCVDRIWRKFHYVVCRYLES